MNPTFESVSTESFTSLSSGGTLTITKPTGLAENNILVAHLSAVKTGGSNADWNTPSGWTSLLNQNEAGNSNSEARLTVFYKIADSSDVAASNFSFVTNSNAAYCAGALYRISNPSSVIGAIDSEIDTTTPTFTNTITPRANSLILFLTTAADAGDTTGSVSSYAITTDNPTWTEAYDFVGSEGVANGTNRQGIMAGAYASRSASTATGNSTVTFVNYSQNLVGAVVAIEPPLNVNLSMPVINLEVDLPLPSLTIDLNLTMPTININVNLPLPTLNVTENTVWTNESKPSTTWTNDDK